VGLGLLAMMRLDLIQERSKKQGAKSVSMEWIGCVQPQMRGWFKVVQSRLGIKSKTSNAGKPRQIFPVCCILKILSVFENLKDIEYQWLMEK
jgi:hypothetical protein